jgi:mRNA interferase RelE/StbE
MPFAARSTSIPPCIGHYDLRRPVPTEVCPRSSRTRSARRSAKTRKTSHAFAKRAGEKTLSYEELLTEIKADGAPWAAVQVIGGQGSRSIPRADGQRILARTESLRNDRRPPVSENLSRQERYRLRQGNYRTLYSVLDAEGLGEIVKVGHRRDVYRA